MLGIMDLDIDFTERDFVFSIRTFIGLYKQDFKKEIVFFFIYISFHYY